MNAGMVMMLKSFGFDPETIKKELESAKNVVNFELTSIKNSLNSIMESLRRLELKLDTLPQDEVDKIIASKTPEEIQKEMETMYGRNNGNGD